MFELYISVLKKFATFEGRASRREYWSFILINFIFSFVLNFLSTGLFGIYALILFLPSLAVLVRRLHDIDKSGWWFFITLIPLIGGIWLLILLASEPKQSSNRYGEILV